MGKVGKNSLVFHNVYIKNVSSVVGPKEFSGPIGEYFDKHYDDLLIDSSKSFEKAEMHLFKDALDIVMKKGKVTDKDINCLFSGDLNNQIIIGNYVMRDYRIPYIGIFGACSTSVLGLITGANYLQSAEGNVITVTSSHNATAERQFRFPNEYGGQKANTATLTVTGAAATLLTTNKTNIKLSKATVGRVVDPQIKDSQDMGRIMAPAAYSTIKQHFEDFNVTVDDYDLIISGDLSYYGSDMLVKLLKEDGIDISNKYKDAGLYIYNRDEQNALAGGSGCACLGVVLNALLIKQLETGVYKRILVVGTGALLNPIIVSQKETIPGIAHAVVLEVV